MHFAEKSKVASSGGDVASQLPGHIAIIMDGNGRWARERKLPRFAGHKAGAASVRGITEHCARLGIKQLTLYSFSTENWKRPAEEVDLLMRLYREHLISQRPVMMENNIRFVQIGRRAGLPDFVCEEVDRTVEMMAKNTGMTLCLAINYSSRAEITDAVRTIARDVAAGTLKPEEVHEETISRRLYTAGMPDPDLLIRTAGEMRVSNYLLWQISYAELYVTDVFWPDFTIEQMDCALRSYAGRNRRFGGVDSTNT